MKVDEWNKKNIEIYATATIAREFKNMIISECLYLQGAQLQYFQLHYNIAIKRKYL